MKTIIFAVVIVLGLSAAASCEEIKATVTTTSHYTVITCSPSGGEEIEKAYLTLYASDGQPLSFSMREMNIAYDNTASYVLKGNHDVVEGKCKFVLFGNNKILRESFLVGMK